MPCAALNHKARSNLGVMKITRLTFIAASFLLLLTATGCFRVSSDTAALRDAALGAGFSRTEEKIEFGAGFFTVGLARFASKYVDLPDEARTALGSLRQAECAVYEVHQRRDSLASVLQEADHAMEDRGCERLAAVIQEHQLVAIYIPREMNSAKDVKVSVLVLNGKQLVCATARANASDLFQLAMNKLSEKSRKSVTPLEAQPSLSAL